MLCVNIIVIKHKLLFSSYDPNVIQYVVVI